MNSPQRMFAVTERSDDVTSVVYARDQLIPALKGLLMPVTDDDPNAGVFFAQCLMQLRAVETEDELLEVFMKLSTTAFLGFVLSQNNVEKIDAVLAQAQNIATLFATEGGIEH